MCGCRSYGHVKSPVPGPSGEIPGRENGTFVNANNNNKTTDGRAKNKLLKTTKKKNAATRRRCRRALSAFFGEHHLTAERCTVDVQNARQAPTSLQSSPPTPLSIDNYRYRRSGTACPVPPAKHVVPCTFLTFSTVFPPVRDWRIWFELSMSSICLPATVLIIAFGVSLKTIRLNGRSSNPITRHR